MSAFPDLPLGRPIPDSCHATSCSLPTMRAVRGYEEKDPEITRHMTSGYPRFVLHPLLQQLAAHLLEKQGLRDHTLWLVSSARMAGRLAAHLESTTSVVRVDDGGIHGVAHPASADVAIQAKTFLQHVGGFLSSRAAEDRLVREGRLPASAAEPLFEGDAPAEIRRHLRSAFPGAGDRDLRLTNCGMSAIEAAYRALSGVQAARGRTIWIQLGWLYLDTMALLKKFAASSDAYVHQPDVFDIAALERLFAEKGDRIAGIIAEVPTNPLLQTPDIAAISALAHRHGAAVLLDPSMASAFNLAVLPHADLVAVSLTKYTASEGDLLAGLVTVNPAGRDADALRASLDETIEPLYGRDLARLALEIGRTGAVLAQMHASVPRVAAFLASHPAVKEVFWALHPASRENYLKIARSPDAVGGMITFTLRGGLESFYDRVALAKGPSFGMKTTLICPFMFLAHYNLVTTDAGRAELAASGIDPCLLRLGVGCEPAEDIIAALAAALEPLSP
jgi:cystathionine gamma-synthase